MFSGIRSNNCAFLYFCIGFEKEIYTVSFYVFFLALNIFTLNVFL